MEASKAFPLPSMLLSEASQWGPWSQTVRNTLRAHNLLEHLTSSGPTLAPAASSTTPGSSPDPPASSPPSATEFVSNLATWRTEDYRVMEWLTRCLGNQLIMEVGALPTAAAMWARLTERFEQRSGARAAHLYHQVWTMKRTDASCLEHIGRLQLCWNELHSMEPAAGSTHNDWVVWRERQEVYQLFATMPEHSALATQLFSQREFPSLSEAIAIINHQEALQQNVIARAGNSPPSIASPDHPLLATPAPTTGSTPRCTYCHRQNHRVETCWILHPELRNNTDRGRGRGGARGRGRQSRGLASTAASTADNYHTTPPVVPPSTDNDIRLQIANLQRQIQHLSMGPGYISGSTYGGSASPASQSGTPAPWIFDSGSTHGQDSWRWF